MDIKELEQRIIDLERRFFPIEKVMYDTSKNQIEGYKQQEIDNSGTEYTIQAEIETDLGVKLIQFKVKAWSPKQALYYANQNIIYPNLSKLINKYKILYK